MLQVTDEQLRLLTLCAIRVPSSGKATKNADWSLLAREASRPGGLAELYQSRVHEQSPQAYEAQCVLQQGLRNLAKAQRRVDAELDMLASMDDVRLVTVLDDEYPATLKLIRNLPPFLFVRGGTFTAEDLRSVAIVGTREASAEGMIRAARLSTQLIECGVVVLSGLAKGIDTAAHSAALDAGGRTLAVVGTGICHTYPKENRPLADRIVGSGGLIISQFWPSTRPAKWTFPRRNVVMSGLGQGTVVVEAFITSGAKLQARLASEHGKQVFLMKSLVERQPWTKGYVEKRGAIVVESVQDVVRSLTPPESIRDEASQCQFELEL